MTYRIIPRTEWGAQHDNGAGPAPLPATEVWLHHSVTIAPDLLPPFDDDYAAIRTLERIGEDRFGRGISYTFPITPAGLVFEGHSVDRRGAHTAGHNTVGRAICFVGNYETMVPTGAQLDAAAWLLVHGWLAGWWDAVTLDGGHRDLKGTACPGRHAYAAMADIDRRAQGLAAALFQAPPPAPSPPTPPTSQEDDDMQIIVWYRDAAGNPHAYRQQGIFGVHIPTFADVDALKAFGVPEFAPPTTAGPPKMVVLFDGPCRTVD